jgi:hypothetical protein
MKMRRFIVVVSSALLLSILYVVLYLAMLDPEPPQQGPHGMQFRALRYRTNGKTAYRIFMPLYWLDYRIRPAYWMWIETDEGEHIYPPKEVLHRRIGKAQSERQPTLPDTLGAVAPGNLLRAFWGACQFD